MKPAIILIVLSSAILHGAYGQSTEVAVEKFAQFPDGADKFYEYVKQKVSYPADARKDSLSGVVYVEFIVDANGAILPESVKVVKGLSQSCDAEAVRVIKGAPKWTPAASKTAAIQQWISFPVSFVFE